MEVVDLLRQIPGVYLPDRTLSDWAVLGFAYCVCGIINPRAGMWLLAFLFLRIAVSGSL